MTDQQHQALVATMYHWGFAAFSPLHLHSPGHRLLAVAMRPEPTKAHFDPESMTLMAAPAGQAAVLHTFHYESPLHGSIWSPPGRVVLRDRVNKVVEYYTFGAQLHAEHLPAPPPCTLYVLESSAPIIAVTTALSRTGATQLVDEVEALFARIRPDERRNGQALADALADLDPIYIYAGCIESLHSKYSQARVLQVMFPTLFALLQHELVWIRNLLGGPILAVDVLLRNPPPAVRRVDSRSV